MHREGHDFYVTRRDMSTGTVDAGNAGVLDLAVIENDPGAYERLYDGLHTSIQYRFGADVEMFIQPEVTNIFNEDGQDGGSTSERVLQSFNPWTEDPVEGVHWEKRSSFGQPTSETSFQNPREFKISLGIRF